MSGRAPELALTSQFIRAGAGAGKTRRLIHSFIDFATEFKKLHNRWPRVVMTTFTRKATQEVKERLLVEALVRGQKDLFEYINQKSFVHISTIHGLLSLLLAQHSDQLRFPQDIRIVEGVQADRVLKKQINEVFKTHPEFVDLLETYTFKDLVGLAKKALEYKAQYPKFRALSRDEMIKMNGAIKQRLAEMISEIFKLAENPEKGWIGYFEYLGRLQIALQEQNDVLFNEIYSSKPRKPNWKAEKPSLDPSAHEVLEELNENLKAGFDTADFIDQHEKLNSLFSRFIELLYEKQFDFKQKTGQLTISDLESLTLQLIQKHPQSVADFSETWDYFMVDEYQDTSPIQVQILNAIISQKPCFVVGDPQQSIYLFRGARSEVFDIKQKEMTLQKAQVDILETNYRTNPSLMSHINSIVTGISSQFKPMQLKPESQQRTTAFDTYFVKAAETCSGVLHHIRYLQSQGVQLNDISVLSRQNKILERLAFEAGQACVPVQLQAAAGFEEKREILDLMSFNRFLVNPHDDENFVQLVRSPWLFVSDHEIVQWGMQREQANCSYWTLLSQTDSSVMKKLSHYLNLFDVTGALQTTKQFISDVLFLHFSLYYDSTGRREANVFKYLVTLADAEKQSGFSLGRFLEEQFQSLQSDLGSGQGEAQPVEQPECVSLMTVHAAKGLQFKHVIVLGFSDSIQTTKKINLAFDADTQRFSLSPFSTEEQKIESSFWAKKVRETLNEREQIESERVLYVALTRAIESLSLVADSSKKPNKHSWISKVKWPEVGESTQGQTLISSVEYNQPYNEKTHIEKNRVHAREPYLAGHDEIAETQSITELLQSRGTQVNEIKPDQQLLNLKKAQHGTDLHRLFESMKYRDLQNLRQELETTDLAAVDYLLQINELPITELLKVGHNEWGFGLKMKNRFIQGQIDLWANLSDAVHVIDYKTGSSDPQKAAKAFDQLAIYTQALLEMQQIPQNKKIIHSIIYVVEKTVKQRTFANAEDFATSWPDTVREIFKP